MRLATSRSRDGTTRRSSSHRAAPSTPIVTTQERTTVKNKSKRLKQDMAAAMRMAGIPPQFIYAYERTGFLLLEEGYKYLAPADKAKYDAAIDDYFANNNAK
jgi:hypothetical protein